MVPNEVIERQYQLYRKSRAPRDLAPVLEALAPKLLAAAARAGLDKTGAEDAMQETFLGLIRAEDKLDSGRPVVPYVNGIALRQIKAEIRRRARLSQIHQPSNVEPQADELPETKQLERAELKDKIRKAVAKLSEGNAAVVSAALFEGLSIEEISTKLNISHSAAAVRLHRGLRRVRESLGSRASLSLLAITIPRHRSVLPGILSSASFSLMGVGSGVLVPIALLLVAGVWGLISLLQSGGQPDDLQGRELSSPSVDVAVVDPQAPDGPPAATAERESVALGVGGLVPDLAAEKAIIVTGNVSVEGSTVGPGGAEVFLLDTTPSIVLPTEPMVPVTMCDAQGRFELDAEMFTADLSPVVVVRAPGLVGYVDIKDEHRESGKLPEVVLREELTITIDVTDTGGAPLEGVELSAVSSSPRFIAPMDPITLEFGHFFLNPYHHLYGAVTDENGRGVIHGIPGNHGKGLTAFLSVKAPGFGRELRAFNLEGETSIDETVVLSRTSELSLGGQVLDSENQPIVGAELRFLARGEARGTDEIIARSDAGGAWSLPHELLDDFPFYVAVEREGFCSTQFSYAGPGELDGEPLDLTLRRTVPFKGRVVDESGRGIQGATIDLTTQFSSLTLESDEQGEFTVTGLTADPRRLRVSGPVEGGSTRSIAVDVDANATSVEVALEQGSEVAELIIRQAEGIPWERVELIPIDAGTESRVYIASKIEGEDAYFQGIRTGRWLVTGVTKESASCVKPIELHGGQASSTHEISQDYHTSLKLWTDQLPDHRPANGSTQGTFLAKSVGIDWLPDWLENTRVTPRTMLRYAFQPETELVVPRLVPGTWDLYGFGEGWAIEPLRLTFEAGAQAAPTFTYTRAGLVTFHSGYIHRGITLLIEIRRNSNEPWIPAADFFQSNQPSFEHQLWLPEGNWNWRANAIARTKEGERFLLIPTETGEVEIDLVTPTAVTLWE